MTTAPRCRNVSDACLPHMMSDVAGTYQYGFVVRLDMGLTIFRRTINADPLDPASYVTADLSANATVVAVNIRGHIGVRSTSLLHASAVAIGTSPATTDGASEGGQGGLRSP